MKRIKYSLLIIISALALTICLASCGNDNKDIESEKEPVQGEITVTLDDINIADDEKIDISEWPRIDGALAMLPYYQEAAAKLLDISTEEAAKHVLCNNTPTAFKSLADKTTDLIFCALPSIDQLDYAASKKVTFETVQILNSGFVFFVNKNNPVDSLTKEQLSDIYAGKITNWKDVGGNDAPIVAYQRNEGSGSQTGLYEHVIPQEDVMDAPTEKKIGFMSEIIDSVANYDGEENGIGFSYYYYVVNMHYQEDVKLLKINDIEPNQTTISSGEYPLISKTCAIFRSSEPEDSIVRKIADWCSSEHGHQLALALGYIPSVASGVIPTYAKIASPGYVNSRVIKNNIDITYVPVEMEEDQSGYSFNGQYIEINGLKDKTIQSKINKTILDVFNRYKDNVEYIPAYTGVEMLVDEFNEKSPAKVERSLYTTVQANVNNILSISVTYSYNLYGEDKYSNSNKYQSLSEVACLNFDLRNGSLLTLKDMFDNGFEYQAYLDAMVYEKINESGGFGEEGNYDDLYSYDALLLNSPFKGVPENMKFIISDFNGALSLVFDLDTPEFDTNYSPVYFAISDNSAMNLSKFLAGECIFEEETQKHAFLYRDFTGIDKKDEIDYFQDISEKYGDSVWIYQSLYYRDELTENQKNLLMPNIQKLEKMKSFVNECFERSEAEKYKESHAELHLSNSTTRVGDYVIITLSYVVQFSYNNDKNEWMTEAYEDGDNYIFVEGTDDTVTFFDLFVEPENAKGLLRDVFYMHLNKEEIDTKAEGLENLDEFVIEALDSMNGFTLMQDALFTDYDCDLSNLLREKCPEYSSEDTWKITSSLSSFTFEEIGYDKLTLF